MRQAKAKHLNTRCVIIAISCYIEYWTVWAVAVIFGLIESAEFSDFSFRGTIHFNLISYLFTYFFINIWCDCRPK